MRRRGAAGWSRSRAACSSPHGPRRTRSAPTEGCQRPCGSSPPPGRRARAGSSRTPGSGRCPPAPSPGRSARPRAGAAPAVARRLLRPALRDGTSQALRDLPAGREVHVHVEEAGARLGEDLGEPGGARQVVAGACVGPAGALEEHDRLEHVRVGSVARGGGVHKGRKRATRAAVATAPPGLFAYSTWLRPAAARSSSRGSWPGR